MNLCSLYSFCLGICFIAVSLSLPLKKEGAKKRVSHELTNQEEELRRLADKASRSSVTLLQDEKPSPQEAATSEGPHTPEDDSEVKTTNKGPWTSVVRPEIVARYLMQSGDLKDFINSLQELVNEDKLKLSEAERYEQSVADAYRSLAAVAESSTQASHAPVKTVTSVSPPESSSAQPVSAKVPQEPSGEASRDDTAKTSLLRERLSYVTAMQATVRRLFQEAVENGNKKSEQTLRDFIDYVAHLAKQGQLQRHEVAEVVDLMTAAVSQELKRLTAAAEAANAKEDKSKATPDSSPKQH